MSIVLNPLLYSGLDNIGPATAMSIGSTVLGSTPHSILKIDASNNLAE